MNQDCIDAIKNVFHFMSEDEIRDYAKGVFNKAREYEELGPQASIQRAIDEAHNDVIKQFFDSAQETARNKMVFESIEKTLRDNKRITLRDIFAPNPKNQLKRGENVQMAQRASANFLGYKFFEKLSPQDIAYFENPENATAIAQAWMDAIHGRESTNLSPEAKKLGRAFKEYSDESTYQMTKNHLLPLENVNKFRFLKTLHNPAKMMGNVFDKAKSALKFKPVDIRFMRNKWVNYILPRLDSDETFGGTKYENDEAGQRGYLHDLFNRIVQGQDNISMKTGILTDLEAVEKRRHMSLVFKDAPSWVEYNQEYGHGTLPEAILADIHGVGGKVGMAKIMGTKPAQMLEHLRGVQDEVNPKGAFWWRNTVNTFKEVSGESHVIESPTMAQFGSNIRQWTSMSSLPLVVIQSLNDMNMASSWMSRWGGNYFRQMGRQFDGLFRQYSDPEKLAIAKTFHVHLANHGGYMGRFSQAENMGKFTSYVSAKYFKAIGMGAWDKGNKMGVIGGMMHDFGNMSHLSFNKLPDLFKKQMGQFGLSAREWEVLRGTVTKSNNGILGGDKILSLDNVLQLSNDQLKEIQKDFPSQALHEIRDNLYTKLFSVFDTGAENAILRPGAYERAIMYQGTRPGTIAGEALRMMMQFKGFPFTYLSRQLFDGFRNADTTSAKLYYAAQQFAYTMPLSMMSTYFYYRSHGLSMPDPAQMNAQEGVNFWAQMFAPSFGVMLNVLDPDNQNPNLVLSLFSSPSIRFLGSALSAPLALTEGNPQKATNDVTKALQTIFPSTNLPGVSPYIKQALGQRMYMQPGQQQLYGGGQ